MLKTQMNGDPVTVDLTRKRSSNESFCLMGQPDITLREGKAEANSKTTSKTLAPSPPLRYDRGIEGLRIVEVP